MTAGFVMPACGNVRVLFVALRAMSAHFLAGELQVPAAIF